MEVAGDDGVERAGLGDHAGGDGVDEHLVGFDIREPTAHFGGDFVPKHHAMALGVALGDDGQLLARAALGQGVGEAHDAGHAGTGEDGSFGGDLLGQAAMGASAVAGILALAVLANDDPIEIGVRRDVAEGRLDAGEHAGRAYVGVLVEALADAQAETPEGDVVGDGGVADGAEIDGVEGAEGVEAVLGHHEAGAAEVVRAPIEVLDGEPEAAEGGFEGLEDGESGGYDFLADAIAGDGGNPVGAHGTRVAQAGWGALVGGWSSLQIGISNADLQG